MHNLFLLITIFSLGCSSKNKKCNPNLTSCNIIWEKIYKEQSTFTDNLHEYFYFEQNKNEFTKDNFIKFIALDKANDSLISLLNQIDFKLEIEDNQMRGITNLSMLTCATDTKECNDSMLNKNIVLFTELVENANRHFRMKQTEIFPFSDESFIYEQKKFITDLKHSFIKLKFRNKLLLKEELFTKNEIKNHQKIRKTILSIKRKKDTRWKCKINESDHKNAGPIEFGKELIVNYLNTSEEAKTSSIDSIIIVLRYFEKDQSNIN